MAGRLTIDGKATTLLGRLQDTRLSPMEEALFKSWAKANKIEKPDAPDDLNDYRGIYKQTGGLILPNGELSRIAQQTDAKSKLEDILYKQMDQRIQEVKQKQADGAQKQADQQRKDKRQDVTHKQRVEMEQLKLKRVPHEAKMKEMDVQKQQLGNEAKQLDITKTLVTPQGTENAPAENSSKA